MHKRRGAALFDKKWRLKINAASAGARWGGITSAIILGAAVLLKFLLRRQVCREGISRQ